MQDCRHWLSRLSTVLRRKGVQAGHKGALGRVQSGKEVPRLVNRLLDNAYKLIAPVGRTGTHSWN